MSRPSPGPGDPGVDTVWLSPWFASPLRDAGHDVADYFTIAPRYGSNDDLAKLVDQAGHRASGSCLTSFRAIPPSPSPGTRPGGYLPNFFSFQPALNYGYGRTDPAEPWRQPADADGPRANRGVLRQVMRHWLSLGVSGFRWIDYRMAFGRRMVGSLKSR